MRRLLAPIAPLALLCAPASGQHNYSEALQKALFFYEVQAAGIIPLDHRAEWRGDACTRDGEDVGRDLVGGWFDAGDGVVWTGNEGFGASLLAWSIVKYRDVYIQTGQYQIAMDRLGEICDYLVKTVQLDGGGAIERLYCGKGSVKDRPPNDPAPDNDRTEGCPNEAIAAIVGGAPQSIRPSYWVDATTGGADVAGAVAAALASASVAFRDYDDAARADDLLELARLVYAWGRANPNLNLTVGGTATSIATRRLTGGAPVTLSTYEGRTAKYIPRMLYGAAWLHRAETAAATPGYTQAYVDDAVLLFNDPVNTAPGKPWSDFATWAPHNGACAMLAADTGRAPFVAEANAYADFWLYDRSNNSGLTTDPTTSPQGFIARTTGAGWTANILMDQAPPLLDWADSPFNTNPTRKANLVALYTGTYAGPNGNECPVKQIDYLLGSNAYQMSYLAGYKPAGAGYSWVPNLFHRAINPLYGGFGTPSADKPQWNTHVAYGTLAPGPDKTDYFPREVPLTGTVVYAYQEPIIYSGGILTVLARNIRAGGPNAGAVLPVFPEWEDRGAGYQTSAFFVQAFAESATRVWCQLNNRARFPVREGSNLLFRYYFTPDGVPGANVACTATGSGLLAGESVSASGPLQDQSGNWYFRIQFSNTNIVMGESSRYRRTVRLDFSQTGGGSFSLANDHSGAALTAALATIPGIPVYETVESAPRLLGGFEPTAGYIQWRRAHFNNAMESAPAIILVAERIGGTQGAVSATISLADATATLGDDYAAPADPLLAWAAGEAGEKTIAIPLVGDPFDEGRHHFTATLTGLAGGARGGAVTSARVSIEDDDFGGIQPTPLAQWRFRHFGSADNAGDSANDADPEPDGLPNLIEYVFGLDPTRPSPAPAIALAVADIAGTPHLQLSFTPANTAGVTLAVESSTDLISWPVVHEFTGAIAGEPLSWRAPLDPVRFLRVKVSSTQ